MKFHELYEQCKQSSARDEDVEKYFRNKKEAAEKVIPEEIVSFIEKFKKQELFSLDEFKEFFKQLNHLDNDLKKPINNLVCRICLEIDRSYQEEIGKEIEEDANYIESLVKKKASLPSYEVQKKTYFGLINVYNFFSNKEFNFDRSHNYPNFPGAEAFSIRERSCLALNVLRLVGKLPLDKNYYGIDLSKPYYPVSNVEKKVNLEKGIKKSDEYFLFKQVKKLFAGDDGDSTFLAINPNKPKIMYVRLLTYSPDAVLASKIATLINKDYFSSERQFDNLVSASRSLSGYYKSCADKTIYKPLIDFIKSNKTVLPGAGVINEVLKFVSERDRNVENLGLSSEDFSKSHLTKIDFDNCKFSNSLSVKDYEEENIVPAHFRNDKHPDYIKEQLYTRLKLSMIPESLFRGLAKKAYSGNEVDKVSAECKNRSEIAFALFLNHPEHASFIKNNLTVTDDCFQEMKKYIESHFDKTEHHELLDGLEAKKTYVVKRIKEIQLNPTDAKQHLLDTKIRIMTGKDWNEEGAQVLLDKLKTIGQNKQLSLIEKQRTASAVVEEIIPKITSNKEIVKLSELITRKDEADYNYIRARDISLFNTYGNTNSWSSILNAIKKQMDYNAEKNIFERYLIVGSEQASLIMDEHKGIGSVTHSKEYFQEIKTTDSNIKTDEHSETSENTFKTRK